MFRFVFIFISFVFNLVGSIKTGEMLNSKAYSKPRIGILLLRREKERRGRDQKWKCLQMNLHIYSDAVQPNRIHEIVY